MRSIFAVALLFAAVLALPSPRPIQMREPLVSMPLVARRNANLTFRDVLEADRARFRHLLQTGQNKTSKIQTRQTLGSPTFPISASNNLKQYSVLVGIGSPLNEYNLLLDTASSTIWVGADQNHPFVSTSSTQATEQNIAVTYPTGSFSGVAVVDTVTLSPNLVIKGQSVGTASLSEGFDGVDGVLGLGPSDLNVGTLIAEANVQVPTVVDNLRAQKTITSRQVGISFEPSTTLSITNGEITFGGVDQSKISGSVTYFPITSSSPANKLWGLDQSILYGAVDIVDTAAGIIDVSTTHILLPTDAFKKYQSATGGVLDEKTGLLKITADQFANLDDLNFIFSGGHAFTMTPDAQIWPRGFNNVLGGDPGAIYLIVADGGGHSVDGSFILGQNFMQRFYVVLDSDMPGVGLANTQFTTGIFN